MCNHNETLVRITDFFHFFLKIFTRLWITETECVPLLSLLRLGSFCTESNQLMRLSSDQTSLHWVQFQSCAVPWTVLIRKKSCQILEKSVFPLIFLVSHTLDRRFLNSSISKTWTIVELSVKAGWISLEKTEVCGKSF